MYLTLPIPVTKYVSRVFRIVPADPRKQRLLVKASYTTNASFAQVKKHLSSLVDIPAANVSRESELWEGLAGANKEVSGQLLATDQFNHNIYAYLNDDEQPASKLRNDDVVVLHEMPYAVSQSNDKAFPASKDDSRDVVVVPVFSLVQRNSYQSNPDAFLEPFYIELTRTEAKDERAIKRKVAEYYAELVDVEEQDGFVRRFENDSKEAPTDDAAPTLFDLTFAAADTGEKDRVSFGLGSKSTFFRGKSTRRLSAAETLSQRKGLFNRAEKMVKSFGRSASDDEEALVDWKDALFPVWDVTTAQQYFGNDLQGRYRDGDTNWVQVTDPAILERAKTAHDSRHITLADCLDDFEREETLGENDLWYCSEVGSRSREVWLWR